jgi:hypothetical protein
LDLGVSIGCATSVLGLLSDKFSDAIFSDSDVSLQLNEKRLIEKRMLNSLIDFIGFFLGICKI